MTRFDLKSAGDVALLADPELTLGPFKGLVIFDEIQRRPELFPLLRVLADRPGSETKFLVLGSASPDLLRQTSESLAGRIGYHRLHGFALDDEAGPPFGRYSGRSALIQVGPNGPELRWRPGASRYHGELHWSRSSSLRRRRP